MNEMTRISAQPAYSEAVEALLKRKPQLFIDGAWVDSTERQDDPGLRPLDRPRDRADRRRVRRRRRPRGGGGAHRVRRRPLERAAPPISASGS